MKLIQLGLLLISIACSRGPLYTTQASSTSAAPIIPTLSLVTPTASPGFVTKPTIRVSGIMAGTSVKLYTDACVTQTGSTGFAATTNIDIQTSELAAGAAYTFYANATDGVNTTACSAVLNYSIVSSYTVTGFNPNGALRGGAGSVASISDANRSLAYIQVDGVGVCIGVLVSDEYVLTTASCIDGGTEFEITMGFNDFTSVEATQVILTSTDATPHPGYDPVTYQNNIGVIKLPLSLLEAGDGLGYAVVDDQAADPAVGANIFCLSMDKISSASLSLSGGIGVLNIPVLANGDAEAVYGVANVTAQNIAVDTTTGLNPGSLAACFYADTYRPTLLSLGSYHHSSGVDSNQPTVMTRANVFGVWINSQL